MYLVTLVDGELIPVTSVEKVSIDEGFKLVVRSNAGCVAKDMERFEAQTIMVAMRALYGKRYMMEDIPHTATYSLPAYDIEDVEYEAAERMVENCRTLV